MPETARFDLCNAIRRRLKKERAEPEMLFATRATAIWVEYTAGAFRKIGDVVDLSIGFIADKLATDFSVELLHTREDGVGYSGPKFSTARIATPQPYPDKRSLENAPLLIVSEKTPESCLTRARGVVFLSDTRPKIQVPCIWIRGCKDPLALLNTVLDLFGTYENWISRVREALLRQESIERVSMLIGEVTDNPFWYGDTALHTLAISDDRGLSERSDKWRRQLKTGHYSSQEITTLVKSGELDIMERERHAVLFSTELSTYNMPFVSRTLFLHGSVYGHLFIIELNAEQQKSDLELLEDFGTLIESYLSHAPKIPRSHGQAIEQLLRSKLSGNALSGEEQSSLLDLLGWDDAEMFLTAVFDRNLGPHSTRQAPLAQVQIVRDNLPGRALAYESYIVLIVDITEHTIDSLTSRIARLGEKLDWKVGLSEPFFSIEHLDASYEQATVALAEGEKSEPDVSLHEFENFRLDYLCEEIAGTVRRETYVTPPVIKLMRHDEERNSRLLLTYEAYLDNERSVSQTAHELFMHRNSVLYRIDKIRDLLGQDEPQTNDERFETLLALKILHRERPDLFDATGAKHQEGD